MITIRPLCIADITAWDMLYSDYAAFYQVNQTQAMRNKVWSWIHDPLHEVNGLIAVNEKNETLGFVHYRAFARPLSASIGGFIDDLFVTPTARGQGTGKALIDAVSKIGKQQGWSVIRWITAEHNQQARSLYDQVANQTQWVTYDIPLNT